MRKAASLLCVLLCAGALAGCGGASSKYPKYDPAGIIANNLSGATGEEIRKVWPDAEFEFDSTYYTDVSFFGYAAQAFAAPNEQYAGYSMSSDQIKGSEILNIATEVSKDFGKPKITYLADAADLESQEMDELAPNDINLAEEGSYFIWDWNDVRMSCWILNDLPVLTLSFD